MQKITMLSTICAAFALSACGGGGAGSSASSGSYKPIVVAIQKSTTAVNNAGTTIAVSGSATTPNTVIKSMNWSVSPATATLTNADCAAGAKTGQVYTANSQNATGTSSWSCAVGLTAPVGLNTQTVYTLTLTVTDDKGNTQSSTQDVSVAVAPTSAVGTTAADGLLASAGNNFSALPNSTNPLHCSATGGVAPYTYTWSVSNNGGINLPLSAFTGADVSFVAPNTATPALYSFTCVASDANKFTSSSVVSASVNAAASPTTLLANAGKSFSAVAGTKNILHCDATGGTAPYSYQWVISNNGGYNFGLSSYTGADTSFTAPAVTAQIAVSATCRATDSQQITSSSTVNATLMPPGANGNVLVANIAQPPAATPGSTITLDGSSTGFFDAAGSPTTGPATSYTWTSTDPAVVISNPTSNKTSVTFPTTFTSATRIGFTLQATSGTLTSTSSINVLVDPYGPASVSVTPSATSTKGNLAVAIVASATSGPSSPKLYYQWTQISGPAITLGGASTATLGVTPPFVAAGTTAQYVFRVAVGYAPITAQYPGFYFADATMTVTP